MLVQLVGATWRFHGFLLLVEVVECEDSRSFVIEVRHFDLLAAQKGVTLRASFSLLASCGLSTVTEGLV